MILSTRYLLGAFLVPITCLLSTQPGQAQRFRDIKFEKDFLEKGKKIGAREYYGYTRSGEEVVVQRYDHDHDHDHGKLLYFRPGADVTCHAEVSPGQWSYVRPDQPPLFIGSDVALAEYTARLVYPLAATSRNVQGKVVVAFVIDTLGRGCNYHLVQRIGAGCDEEAWRVACTVPEQWVPARLGSRAVAVEYELPLNFRLAQP